jgi:hypothetical protein
MTSATTATTVVTWKPSPLSFRVPTKTDKMQIFHGGKYDCGVDETSFAMIRVVCSRTVVDPIWSTFNALHAISITQSSENLTQTTTLPSEDPFLIKNTKLSYSRLQGGEEWYRDKMQTFADAVVNGLEQVVHPCGRENLFTDQKLVTGISVGIELPVDSGQTPLMMLFEGGVLSGMAKSVVSGFYPHGVRWLSR